MQSFHNSMDRRAGHDSDADDPSVAERVERQTSDGQTDWERLQQQQQQLLQPPTLVQMPRASHESDLGMYEHDGGSDHNSFASANDEEGDVEDLVFSDSSEGSNAKVCLCMQVISELKDICMHTPAHMDVFLCRFLVTHHY